MNPDGLTTREIPLEPRSSALLFIDVHKNMVGTPNGSQNDNHSDSGEQAERELQLIASLAQAARAAGSPGALAQPSEG